MWPKGAYARAYNAAFKTAVEILERETAVTLRFLADPDKHGDIAGEVDRPEGIPLIAKAAEHVLAKRSSLG